VTAENVFYEKPAAVAASKIALDRLEGAPYSLEALLYRATILRQTLMRAPGLFFKPMRPGWLGLDKQWRSRCDRVVPQTTGPCRCILRSLTSSAASASFYFRALQSVRHISRSPEANRENIELANFHESPRPVGPTPGNIQISPSYESPWHQLSFP